MTRSWPWPRHCLASKNQPRPVRGRSFLPNLHTKKRKSPRHVSITHTVKVYAIAPMLALVRLPSSRFPTCSSGFFQIRIACGSLETKLPPLLKFLCYFPILNFKMSSVLKGEMFVIFLLYKCHSQKVSRKGILARFPIRSFTCSDSLSKITGVRKLTKNLQHGGHSLRAIRSNFSYETFIKLLD